MKNNLKIASVIMSVLLLNACASMPNGPSRMALPGAGKSFDQFQADDQSCMQFAHNHIGGATANQVSDNTFAKNAIVGTVIGAALGAALGGHHGAGFGAATGLLFGGSVGANEANASGQSTQNNYDNAYTQCMYAKGHQVPVSGHVMTQQQPSQPTYDPAYMPPPPPPGYYN
ncbi:MAG: YMGG-like glycine zipper-containing protein [Methylophilaceae bacterium]